MKNISIIYIGTNNVTSALLNANLVKHNIKNRLISFNSHLEFQKYIAEKKHSLTDKYIVVYDFRIVYKDFLIFIQNYNQKGQIMPLIPVIIDNDLFNQNNSELNSGELKMINDIKISIESLCEYKKSIIKLVKYINLNQNNYENKN